MQTGYRKGKLVTVKKMGGRPCLWLCKCDCGNEKIIKDVHLYDNKWKGSCGCVGRKRFGKDRFTNNFIEERIEINENGCWIWKGAKHRQGYGNVRFQGKTYLAHRLAWEIYKGKVAEGIKVCHKCDIPSCVNPEHLFLGSQHENVKDAIGKNKFRPGTLPRRNKLNWDQVKEIRELHASGISRKELEQKFQVGQTCIAKILTGVSWRTQEL